MGTLVLKFSCVDFTISGLENGPKTGLTFFSIFPKNSLISRMPRMHVKSVVPEGGTLLSVELATMGRS